MNNLRKVNVKQGTYSQNRFSRGNTLPLTALPHSMVAFAPQTDSRRGSWWYSPLDRSLEGIRLTHQPSPWIGDWCSLCFLPMNCVESNVDRRWSSFRLGEEELMPHYMKIRLLRYKVTAELTPTDCGAVGRLSFDEGGARFGIFPCDRMTLCGLKIGMRTISGYVESPVHPGNKRLKMYFVFRFDCKLTDAVFLTENGEQTGSAAVAASVNVGLSNEKCQFSLATSYISLQQAKLNLRNHCSKSFVGTKSIAAKKWNEVLDKIEVHGTKQQERTFYSCLYRTFLYPTKFFETDENGYRVYFDAENDVVKRGVMYVNNGYWDTFRTVYPLYALICPEKYAEMVEAILNFYDDSGYLPRWPSPTEAGMMPSVLSEVVLADAVVKNVVSDSTALRVFEALQDSANRVSGDARRGRKCVEEYQKLGYVPYDKCHESVNETLDSAYGDYCVGAVAEKLGKHDVACQYFARSKNYVNLFDSKTGFMRAKDSNGNFRPNFDSLYWGRDYTEACAWQTTLAVQHDVDGLAKLFGGTRELEDYLNRLVNQFPNFNVGGYGCEIHEMSEMAAVDFGQCAISNQPSFHIPYLFSAVGDRKATNNLVDRLLQAFSENHFPGDEDNGTTAAWYVFAALGFYPLCPGKNDYALGKCLFKSAYMLVGERKVDVKKLVEGAELHFEDFLK